MLIAASGSTRSASSVARSRRSKSPAIAARSALRMDGRSVRIRPRPTAPATGPPGVKAGRSRTVGPRDAAGGPEAWPAARTSGCREAATVAANGNAIRTARHPRTSGSSSHLGVRDEGTAANTRRVEAAPSRSNDDRRCPAIESSLVALPPNLTASRAGCQGRQLAPARLRTCPSRVGPLNPIPAPKRAVRPLAIRGDAEPFVALLHEDLEWRGVARGFLWWKQTPA